MNKTRLIWLGILCIGFTLLLAACVAERGPAGPTGPRGIQGVVGMQGPAGQDGAPGVSYIQPPGAGLKVKITGVDIPKDGNPVVRLTLTDDSGIPLTLADALEGYGFTIAQLSEDKATNLEEVQNLLMHDVVGKPYQVKGETKQPVMEKAAQAFADTGGAWAKQDDGSFTYTFKNPLTSPVDPSLMTMVGVYAWRNNRQTVSNNVFSFVPSGRVSDGPALQIVSTAACQNCHNPLQAHGGTRRDVSLCVTCHTSQMKDPETGNSLDLRVLVHRLHFGKQLPSVKAGTPYQIVGHNQTVVDFSKDTWPQDLRFCITCHTGGEQHNNYKLKPNTAACTSCHDTTNVSTGENHPGGKQTDSQCPACHEPDSGSEFDASITGAHIVPYTSKMNPGLKLEILSVEGTKPGSSPTVKFKVSRDGGQPVDLASIDYLAVTLAGPTSNYGYRWTETIISTAAKTPSLAQKVSDGIGQYQLKAKIPEGATGSYAIGMEGYFMQKIAEGQDPLRVAAFNPVTYFSVDGGQPEARRQVIDQTKCNVCHMRLTMHGSIRQNVEYCVMCHNSTATDEERRPKDAMPPTSINFPLLIHRIHTGQDAAQPLQVYGYGGTLNDFSDIMFPGNRSACQTCHLPGTYGLPLPGSVTPTTITQAGKLILSILPIRTICTSCHDDQATNGHADLQTTSGGVETCLVCHGPNREADVTKVHK